MSYGAERWAREKCLDFKGDQTGLAVLKEIAYWFLDDEMICKDVSQGDLAKLLGLKRQQTIADALKRLSEMGLVKIRKVIDQETGNVTGTNFYLPKYIPDEWPVSRQGKAVFLRKIPQARITEEVAKTDLVDSTDLCGQTDLCGLTEEGMRFERVGVCGLTEEGYAVKPQTNTGNKQGITGNKQGEFVDAFENAPPPTDSDLEAMASSGSLFAEADVPAEEPPKKQKRCKPKVPCPFSLEDSLSDDWRAEFSAKYPTVDLDHEFAKFVSHAIANDIRHAVWKAAFHTWCRNSLKWVAEKKSANRNQPQRRPYVPGDRKFSYATLDTSQFDYEG